MRLRAAGVRLPRAALAGGSAVLLALVAWNLGNLVFFVLAGRLLGPEDYGVLAALLAVTMVALVPASALQYGIARLVAGDAEVGAAVYAHAWRRVAAVSAAATVVAIAVLAAAGARLSLPVGETIVTVLVIAPLGVMFLSLGTLQGERRFSAFSWSFALMGVLRAPLLLLLFAAGLGVYSGLWSSAAAVAAAAALAAALTMGALTRPPGAPPREWRPFVRALAPLALGLGGIAVLTNLDIVVAKLALPATDAGHFAAAAVLAKGVIVVPQAVAVVVLPRIAARRRAGAETGSLLALAVLVSALAGLAGAALFALVGDPLIDLTYGGEFSDTVDLLVPLALASTLLGILVVLVNHHIGRGANAFIWAIAGVAVVEAALFIPFHGSAGALVAVDAAACAAGIVVHELIHGRSEDGVVRGLVALAGRASRQGSTTRPAGRR